MSRPKQEEGRFFEMGGEATAITAERNLSSVLAVPETGKVNPASMSNGSNGSTPMAVIPKISGITLMTADEERAIRGWLAQIGETEDTVIAEVVNRCRHDARERRQILLWAAEVETADRFEAHDERRRCKQCANLTKRGLCLAAWRGEINASRLFFPVPDLLQRCSGYLPGPDDTERRSGRERWPEHD